MRHGTSLHAAVQAIAPDSQSAPTAPYFSRSRPTWAGTMSLSAESSRTRRTTDGLVGVCHLLDDVVDQGLLGEQHLAAFDLSGKAAAGAEVDEQLGGEAIDHMLGRGRRRDLAPTAVEEGRREPGDGLRKGVPLAERRAPARRVGMQPVQGAPLAGGRHEHDDLRWTFGHWSPSNRLLK